MCWTRMSSSRIQALAVCFTASLLQATTRTSCAVPQLDCITPRTSLEHNIYNTTNNNNKLYNYVNVCTRTVLYYVSIISIIIIAYTYNIVLCNSISYHIKDTKRASAKKRSAKRGSRGRRAMIIVLMIMLLLLSLLSVVVVVVIYHYEYHSYYY